MIVSGDCTHYNAYNVYKPWALSTGKMHIFKIKLKGNAQNYVVYPNLSFIPRAQLHELISVSTGTLPPTHSLPHWHTSHTHWLDPNTIYNTPLYHYCRLFILIQLWCTTRSITSVYSPSTALAQFTVDEMLTDN